MVHHYLEQNSQVLAGHMEGRMAAQLMTTFLRHLCSLVGTYEQVLVNGM